jgi:hypothetical protein
MGVMGKLNMDHTTNETIRQVSALPNGDRFHLPPVELTSEPDLMAAIGQDIEAAGLDIRRDAK